MGILECCYWVNENVINLRVICFNFVFYFLGYFFCFDNDLKCDDYEFLIFFGIYMLVILMKEFE